MAMYRWQLYLGYKLKPTTYVCQISKCRDIIWIVSKQKKTTVSNIHTVGNHQIL